MTCPEVNIADLRALNIFSLNGSVWREKGKPLPNKGYFSTVEEKDQGDYTCTRSYLHNGHVYNMTFTVELSVQQKRKAGKSRILSPSKDFYVDLGSEVVIDCEAVLYSDFDEVFWLRDSSFVAQNKSLPVFYTYRTSESDDGEIHATASLVFKKVSEEDLSGQYRCKLDSVLERSHFVTITLINKGVCLQKAEEVYVQAGEMAVLLCPYHKCKSNSTVVWTGYTHQQTRVLTDMSVDEQDQLGMLVHGRSLVVFSAAANIEGNYSCSLRNSTCQSWFSVIVYSTQPEERNKYTGICYTQESCTLTCPEVNIPEAGTLNITNFNSIMWRKEGKPLPNKGYFSTVEEKDQGDYTCTRSYLHNGHVYNMTFTVELSVQPKVPQKTEAITSPKNKDVFEVELGSTVVINCTAVLYSDFDEIIWLSDSSFVEQNHSFPVFYNYTRKDYSKETKATASLVFKNVSEEDLLRSYTCKLESSSVNPYVVIYLVQKARPSHVSLFVVIACMVVAMTVIVVIYVKFKVDMTLLVRDTLGCWKPPSDGKSYDAFLLCYNSHTDAGLKDCDRKWLEGILESCYGYSLCLCERDVLPGEAEVEAVLDCIEKSRTVVLVPASSDSDPGSGLLSAIHAALVERQSHLVSIKTESGVLPEALHHLVKAGDSVTWRGPGSMATSSPFLKQLRYYLPAPQHPPKPRPQTVW
ncbi:interleukin-18 receptor 1-like isoform X2 [Betta splendens]|nr:interleukin-18 receptor 1-like isoform X2 [Betta splendens]